MSSLPCLSVRQPWAWLIVNGFKPIENRTWRTRFRGRILIHAGRQMTCEEWRSAAAFAVERCEVPHEHFYESGAAHFSCLDRGGIVGSVEIVDCVDEHDSSWFVGPFGFVLRDPRARAFTPYRGALTIFQVPEAALL